MEGTLAPEVTMATTTCSGRPVRTCPAERFPGWFLMGFFIAVGCNTLATLSTYFTIELMRGVSEFAQTVRQRDRVDIWYYNMVAYPVTTTLVVAYMWPIIAHFRRGGTEPPSELVRRRAISSSFFLAAMGFVPWAVSAIVFPLLTVLRYGHWSTDLMSQHVLSPLVNGFLAATTSYLLFDWVYRVYVAPRIFADGRLAMVPGSIALGVGARMYVFLIAVAFLPLFTMLGLVQAAAARIEVGVDPLQVLQTLTGSSQTTFFLYVLLALALTAILSRTLTAPLRETARALQQVQAGNLDLNVRVESHDEIGVLQDGVNSMVDTLRDQERILQTFGRVVEPAVRDHLLSGDLRLGGEIRYASVLFCDLRGFTSMSERTTPTEMVSSLNEFFTTMTLWVRDCDGFVNKFIGDAMMVVFGVFDSDCEEKRARAAAAAIRCGLGINTRLAELNARRVSRNQPPLAVSMGLHSGEVLAGTIGAIDRHEYTVIGDTVNVAARLQELCRDHGHSLLLSESTYAWSEQAGHTPPVIQHEAVSLRGRSELVRLYALT